MPSDIRHFMRLPHLPVAKREALCFLLRVQVFINGAAMKRTDRISPIVWAIGIIVIAATIFLAWLGRHSQRAHSQPEELSPTLSAGAGSATRSVTAGSAQNSRNIQITVTDPGGSPLGNSHLQVRYILQEDGTATLRSGNSFATDSNGVAIVACPQQNLNTLEISASHENFSGRKMNWSLASGDVVPSSHTLKLGAEARIGAIIVDSDNNPIPGATVSLRQIGSAKSDAPNKKGEQSDFPPQTRTTGADGRWHASALPADLMDSINFQITHSDFSETNITVGADPAIERQLRDESLRIVLPSGAAAHGLVIDESDKPIAGATVRTGGMFTRDRQQTKTDSQGRFDFKLLKGGTVAFFVSAPGHAPATRSVAMNSSTPDIVFKLSAGWMVHGVVQNESGSPLEDVEVSLDNTFGFSGNNAYDFSTLTDVEGKFSWNSAPAEPLRYTFIKTGYEKKRNVLMAQGEDNVITLRAPRRLEGLVVDANSGQPIPQFSIRTGNRSIPDQTDLYGTIGNRDFNTPDGRFTWQLENADENAVQVWNDDHSLKTESFPEAENGVIRITIRLDPADALKGIVTTADGTPVPGANVFATSGDGGGRIQLQGSSFRSYDPRTQVELTDQQGAFSVKRPPQHGTVMAIANAGFAMASVDEVRANHLLVIQAFGRIEGTLKVAGTPAAGQSLVYQPPHSTLMADSQTYKTITDDEGHFTMEKIPPGEGSIVRMISITPNITASSYRTPVMVQPGQTTQVTLGDSGAVLRGTVRFESPPTNGEAFIINGRFSTTAAQLPDFSSSTERQKYIDSPEWQAQMKRMKNYFFMVSADGNFQVDSVEPGSYTIDVSANSGGDMSFMSPGGAHGTLPITVPDNADPMDPIFVGEIVLRPPPVR
jgi:uncharacterized GH25 family protein